MLGRDRSRRHPVPATAVDLVGPPGFERVRAWGDVAPPFARELHDERHERIRALYRDQGEPPEGLELSFLTISGGATYGAYSAGLLCGWTEHGSRPTFQVVTGVSVGALIAPFAFLGPSQDDRLRDTFRTAMPKQIATPRLLSLLFGAPSLLDPRPLRRAVETLVTTDLLQAVGEASREGRQLLVGTTNLDAARFVIWDLGRIASYGTPEAFALARQVILASASVPGAFPPVLIDVARPEHPDERFQEAHIDGGATNNVFAYPYQLKIDVDEAIPAPVRRRIFVVQNDYGRPPYRPVALSLPEVLRTAVAIQNHYQSLGDVNRIHAATQRDGFSFRLAAIPGEFDQVPEAELDLDFMNGLFDLGFREARDGYPWRTEPPEQEPSADPA
ncbi:MAG TPA: patatin-like phospholipase family protein [Polyangiaceae bacterium LLY-WYZ-14_1]|nr:patatin-like phospholipase family protein [Polyangiaceae bacterium LLY-WYZ-14_1]